MHELIVKAITEQRLLAIYYDPGPRVIEPCAYGLSAERHGLLRAFQRDGASAHGEPVHWKLFRTDRIKLIQIQEEGFAVPPAGYRRGDKAMKGGIYCQL